MNFQKFASDAASAITRAVQLTGEKLGKAEKTEYDAQFENLFHRADQFQQWTERILQSTESFLQPNPAHRVENFVCDKLDRSKRSRTTTEEDLGAIMSNAGNEMGPGTPYGNALIRCGATEMGIGQAHQEFIDVSSAKLVRPLRNYLEEDLKTVLKERKMLEAKRLDLDACKTKLKWAQTEAAKKAIENQVIAAQSEFERQLEVTKILLDSISSTQNYHHRCLLDFVKAQSEYYVQCHEHMKNLQMQLGSYPNAFDST